jgi:hypothetical protein
MGWLMGFEPTTTGITIRDSTTELQPPSETGLPDRIRTCDPQLRRLMLYPTELRAANPSEGKTRAGCLDRFDFDAFKFMRRTSRDWSGREDSNLRHLAPKASTLPG